MANLDYRGRRGRTALSRRRLLGAAGGAGTGLFLLACGGDKDEGTGTTGGASAPATGGASATAAAGGEPVYGGVLNIRDARNMSIDPLVDSTSAANIFGSYIYSRLAKFKSYNDPAKSANYEIAPDLATSWEQPDKTTFTFKLHPQAKFHNRPPTNGRAVTAEDVVLSYRRTVSEPKNTNKDKMLQTFAGEPVALDAHTVQIKTKQPFSPFFTVIIANPQYLWVYPRELLDSDTARQTTPVGSGPWMFKRRQESVAWEFDKNPDYYGTDEAGRKLPYLDGVKVNVIPETAQNIAQFLGSNLDVISVEYEDLKQVQDQVKDAEILKGQVGSAYYYLSPQQRRGPFQDIRLRQALSMSHNRDGLLKLLWGGEGWWHNLVPAYMGEWRLDPKAALQKGEAWAKYYEYNPAEAKKLLEAAGHKDPIQYIYSNNAYGDRFNQMAVFSADTGKQAGFNFQVVTQDYRSEFITAGKTFFGFYDGVFYAPEAPHTDPYGILFNMLYTGNSWNHAGVADPQADKLIDELAAEFDTAKRREIASAIQRLSSEKVYYATSAAGPSYFALQRWAKNFKYAPHSYSYSTESYATMWIDAKLRR